MRRWILAACLIASMGLAGAIWHYGGPEDPPIGVGDLLERLNAGGVDCRLQGAIQRTNTSLYGGAVDISYETGTCLLNDEPVGITVFPTEEQASEWSQENITFTKSYWYLSDATWEVRTRSDEAARAIHNSMGGGFSGTEWSKHAWSREG